MVNGTLTGFLSLAICLLCLPTTCADINVDDILDLGIPVMVIGRVLYLDFPGNTLHELYECLCDMQIIGCIIIHKQRGEKTSSPVLSLPGFFTVTSLLQTRAITDVTGQYKQVFMCNFPLSPDEMTDCYRPTMRDTSCQDGNNCISYSVQTDSKFCSYNCSQMIWIAPTSVSLDFYNFGEIPKPVENGVCPTTERTSTTPPIPESTAGKGVLTINTTPRDITVSSVLTTDATSGSTVNSSVITATNETQNDNFSTAISQNFSTLDPGGVTIGAPEDGSNRFPLLIPLAATVGVSLLILTSGAAYAGRRFYRSKSSPVASQTGSESVESVSRSASSPENLSSHSIEPDEEGYETLEEVAAGTTEKLEEAECDDKGYHTIQDCFTGSGDIIRGCSRPLPALPNAGSVALDLKALAASLVTAATGTTAATTESVHSPEMDSNQRDREQQLAVSRSKPAPRWRLNDSEKHDGGENLPPVCRPKPKPCRRLTDLDNPQHMGVVSLRHDHPALSRYMQAKLVRTQWGDLELISLPDELLAFTEYYSRLQLVNMRDNSDSLGVVGLSEERAADDDSHKYFDLREVYKHNSRDERQASATLDETKLGQTTQNANNSNKLYPYIFYFGSLVLAEGASVNSYDYLTVLDIDPSSNAVSDHGYLTVLDIDTANVSNSSLYSLAMLEY